jgi:hypothetical protein
MALIAVFSIARKPKKAKADECAHVGCGANATVSRCPLCVRYSPNRCNNIALQ